MRKTHAGSVDPTTPTSRNAGSRVVGETRRKGPVFLAIRIGSVPGKTRNLSSLELGG